MVWLISLYRIVSLYTCIYTHRVDERVVLTAERPTTTGMLAPPSLVPDPRLIVGLRLVDFTGDLLGERRAAAFAFWPYDTMMSCNY